MNKTLTDKAKFLLKIKALISLGRIEECFSINEKLIVMNNKQASPVTASAEQATGYAPAENGNQSLTDSQGSGTPGSNCAAQSNTNSRQEMEKYNLRPVTASAEQATGYAPAENEKEENKKSEHGCGRTINAILPSSELNFCKNAENDIMAALIPEGLAATTPVGLSVVNVTASKKAGLINVARLKMNRKPKEKSIKALKEDMLQIGQQIMLLIIPAKVAIQYGFGIEDFDGTEIPENQFDKTVIIVDGQTRMQGFLNSMKEHNETYIPDLYAHFPLNWTYLDKMLQSINLKVFTWTNSDFMTGVITSNNVNDQTKVALMNIQELESKGYNYTSACEWISLKKGIIRKKSLLDVINKNDMDDDFSLSKLGILIHDAAAKKFNSENSSVLKQKTLPELVITKLDRVAYRISKNDAAEYIVSFFNNLKKEEVDAIANPSDYRRGCGKKKEEFVKKEFEKAFDKFSSTHPYSEFKKNDCK